MRATYKISYRLSGKKIEIPITAATMTEAHRIAQDYCKQRYISFAWVITPYGNRFLV